MRRGTDRDHAGDGAARAPRSVAALLQTAAICVLAIAVLAFIFGPVFGLRDTRTQARSKRIAEEHERHIQKTLEYSERERRRSEDDLKRAEQEIFGKR